MAQILIILIINNLCCVPVPSLQNEGRNTHPGELQKGIKAFSTLMAVMSIIGYMQGKLR